MIHRMEWYFNKVGNLEITDALAELLLSKVMKNAAKLCHVLGDYDVSV